jgi:hypothetical protein
MREVTGSAALGLDRRMLIDERASFLGVTLYADRISGDAAVQPLVFVGAVRIVAVAAVYQSFVHSVTEWLRKGRLDVGMTAIAELRLCNFQKSCLTLKGMYAVATHAAHVSFAMGRAGEVGMRSSVTPQALIIHRFGCCFAEPEDLGYIASRFYMRLAGRVAAFASDPFAAMHEGEPRMRILSKFLMDICMAGLASI